MKETATMVLDDKDMEFIDTLKSLGVQRNSAALITYLANVVEATSREIEIGTGLRQPEVSLAMRALRNNNWVAEREIKAEGKGRPMKVYKLNVHIDKIIEHYEGKKKMESAQAMEAIQRLRNLTTA